VFGVVERRRGGLGVSGQGVGASVAHREDRTDTRAGGVWQHGGGEIQQRGAVLRVVAPDLLRG
jgi:hypothetical protein